MARNLNRFFRNARIGHQVARIARERMRMAGERMDLSQRSIPSQLPYPGVAGTSDRKMRIVWNQEK